MTETTILPLSKRLRAETHADHQALDALITGQAPFASRAGYAKFLAVQFRFHDRIEGLYQDAALARMISGLPERSRVTAIAQDIADLDGKPPERLPAVAAGPRGLGWLYVAEGSSLGAAFLLKEAAALGLNESFGASHLAASSDGRGLHWRRFTEALDALDLADAQADQAVEGAREAFASVQADVERTFA